MLAISTTLILHAAIAYKAAVFVLTVVTCFAFVSRFAFLLLRLLPSRYHHDTVDKDDVFAAVPLNPDPVCCAATNDPAFALFRLSQCAHYHLVPRSHMSTQLKLPATLNIFQRWERDRVQRLNRALVMRELNDAGVTGWKASDGLVKLQQLLVLHAVNKPHCTAVHPRQ